MVGQKARKLRVGLAGAWNSQGDEVDAGLEVCLKHGVGNELCAVGVEMSGGTAFGQQPLTMTGKALAEDGLHVTVRRHSHIASSDRRRAPLPILARDLCCGVAIDLLDPELGMPLTPSKLFDVASILVCLVPADP